MNPNIPTGSTGNFRSSSLLEFPIDRLPASVGCRIYRVLAIAAVQRPMAEPVAALGFIAVLRLPSPVALITAPVLHSYRIYRRNWNRAI